MNYILAMLLMAIISYGADLVGFDGAQILVGIIVGYLLGIIFDWRT